MFIQKLFHFVTFLIYSYGIGYDLLYVTIPGVPDRTFVGRLKFLTFLDLLIQMGYYAFCTILNLEAFFTCSKKKADCPVRQKLFKFRDNAFNIIVFPLGTFIFAMFWGLYAIDRELIFPKILDEVIPGWLNHIMHTITFPTSLIEASLSPHKLPRNKTSFLVIFLFLLIYISWTLYLYYVTNVWTYPIYNVLNWWQLTLFFISTFGVYLLFFAVAKSFTKRIWGSTVEEIIEKKIT